MNSINLTNSVEPIDNENKSTSESVTEQTPKSTSDPGFIKNIRSYVLKKLTPDNKKLILLITFGLVTIVILYTENSNHISQKGGDIKQMVDDTAGIVAYKMLSDTEGFNVINFMMTKLIPLILWVIGLIVALTSPFLMYLFFVYNMLYNMIKTMGTM